LVHTLLKHPVTPLLWINAALALIVVGVMVSGKVEPVVVFMIGTALVLLLNFPSPAVQRRGSNPTPGPPCRWWAC
jgi:Mg2+/citrate symporter